MATKNKVWMKQKRAGAFTLIELLVVIAIIAILAGLIVNLAGRATVSKKMARVRTELAQLETAIDAYKDKKGFYPPSNGNTNNVVTNQLFYELSGTIAVTDGSGNVQKFTTIKGDESIVPTKVQEFFGVEGFANSSTTKGDVKNFLPSLKSSAYQEVVSTPAEVELLVVPVEGPNDITTEQNRKINPWRYNSGHPAHNPDSYDLWAEIVVGGKTNIVGNWKE